MKLRTRVAIALVAVLLTLTGFGILANALSAEKIMASARPTAEYSVSIRG
ncbi:MAG: hypothetical protein ABFD52_03270 [Acidobacteriota bacterium]